ncbi:MAG: signal peptidase I [Actinomycetaceae bacterium]|nr:signal peptidase I [Actinomycetaceae bacterium]
MERTGEVAILRPRGHGEAYENMPARTVIPPARHPESDDSGPTLVIDGASVRSFVLKSLAVLLVIFITLVMLGSIVIPRLMGWVPLSVQGTTMSPTFKPGTEIIVQPLREEAKSQLSVNDVITFQRYQASGASDGYISHRIFNISQERDGSVSYITKGDGLAQPDAIPVQASQVKGIVRYHLPYVGHLTDAMNETQQSLALVGLAGVLFAYAGWQVGTAIINARDPQAQARRARLRAAAAAGRLEADRKRAARRAGALS